MTTIVYKDGVLAADRQINYRNQIFASAQKIFQNEKYIYGACGTSISCVQFIKFVEGKEFDKAIFQKDEHKSFEGIVINKEDGKVFIYDNELLKDEMSGDFFCFGSGGDIAKGALLMGATPKQAIECASKIDHSTGREIDEIKL